MNEPVAVSRQQNVRPTACTASRRDAGLLAIMLLLILMLRLFINQVGDFDLHFDEAQYWEWSQQLDWSYYSKGPLVAWLIALSTNLFGHGEWQVRLFAWLAYSVFLVLLFVFACQFWQSRRAGWWAIALGLTTPLYFPLGQVMTTDVLLFVCWTWALWAAWRAVVARQTTAWYELGAAVGLGSLTKLSIGLLPFFLGLTLLLTPAGRCELRRGPPWVGVLLMLLVFSPVLIWNMGHDWVMFRHEQGHVVGLADSAGVFGRLRDLLEFLAGQFLALSPLVAVTLLHALRHPPREPGQRLLWGLSLAVLALFLAKATVSKVQLNWPAPAYIGLLILLAGQIDLLQARWRRLVLLGMTTSVLLVSVALFPNLVGWSPAKAPFRDLRVWEQPVREVARQAGTVDFLMVPRYHLAGELAFYWPTRLPVYLVGDGRRYSQHDLWPSIDREADRTGVYVTTEDRLHPWVRNSFAACHELRPAPALTPDGRTIRTLHAWRCENHEASARPMPTTY